MRRDRLHRKGLLSRIESKDDTRIRVGALTAKGQRLIVPIFRKHAADIQQVFAEFSSDRLGRVSKKDLKQIDRRADVLATTPQNH